MNIECKKIECPEMLGNYFDDYRFTFCVIYHTHKEYPLKETEDFVLLCINIMY